MVSVFVTVEGVDGSGKSSLIQGLTKWLTLQGIPNLATREPGAGEFGSAIRTLLLEDDDMEPWSEVFLFLADRSEHMVRIIKPALEKGTVVLCDRHADSTVVYQGYARGLDIELLRRLNLLATQGQKPHLTLLLKVDPDTALSRQQHRDRLGSESTEFYHRVANGFLQEAQREPERFQLIDSSLPQDQVLHQAIQVLSNRLELRFE